MKFKKIAPHMLFWVIFLFGYPIWLTFAYSDQYVNNLLSNLTVLPGFICGIYFLVYYLIPKYLLKKKSIIKFLGIYILFMALLIAHELIATRYIFLPLFDPEYIDKFSSYYTKPRQVFGTFIMLQSQIFIFISIKYLKGFIISYFEKEKLKARMVEAELELLKGQIHPHFLFNTLNNIYTLSLLGETDKVSESILRLSDILRFSTEKSSRKFITLKEELEMINAYLNLEKLRYSELTINTDFPENIDDKIYAIPFLFFTFIENAFKHGASKVLKGKKIDIQLKLLGDKVSFVVKNSKSVIKQQEFNDYSNGIGLENARKRLGHYLGENNYNLEVNNSKSCYEIFLNHEILTNESSVFNCG